MTAPAAALADDLLARLRAEGSADRAEGERQYLHSALVHVGVPMPRIRATVRAFLSEHPDIDARTCPELATYLWQKGVYELRQVTVNLLERWRDDLDADAIDLVEGLLRDAHTWALVDPLAINVVGEIALRDARVWTRTDRWVDDEEMWLRRAALLVHLPALRADRTTFVRFAARADALVDERDFFIRKAIGWVLREVARRDAATVTAWLEPRTSRVSGVTLREAVKYLPDSDRDRLVTAYRSRPRTRSPRAR